MDEKELATAYGPYSHAARALCLWRGTEAWEFWKSGLGAEDSQLASGEQP
jgi:hypothetical protein